MVKKRRTIYRDSKTGRFASRATWKRSRARGGTRYKRTRIKIARGRAGRPLPKPPRLVPSKLPTRPQEWLTSFTYEASGKSVDYISVALDEETAFDFVVEEVQKTRAGRSMLRHFKSVTLAFEPPNYRAKSDIGEVKKR